MPEYSIHLHAIRKARPHPTDWHNLLCIVGTHKYRGFKVSLSFLSCIDTPKLSGSKLLFWCMRCIPNEDREKLSVFHQYAEEKIKVLNPKLAKYVRNYDTYSLCEAVVASSLLTENSGIEDYFPATQESYQRIIKIKRAVRQELADKLIEIFNSNNQDE